MEQHEIGLCHLPISMTPSWFNKNPTNLFTLIVHVLTEYGFLIAQLRVLYTK